MESAVDGVYRYVPREMLPDDVPVVGIVSNEQIIYLIAQGTTLEEAIAYLDRYATHIIRHGLWVSQPEQYTPPRLRHVS